MPGINRWILKDVFQDLVPKERIFRQHGYRLKVDRIESRGSGDDITFKVYIDDGKTFDLDYFLNYTPRRVKHLEEALKKELEERLSDEGWVVESLIGEGADPFARRPTNHFKVELKQAPQARKDWREKLDPDWQKTWEELDMLTNRDRELRFRGLLSSHMRKLASALDGQKTGDRTGVGLFIPLPPELAKQFPKKSKDKSPPHITFLYVGDVPEAREEEFLLICEKALAKFGPVQANLSGLNQFINQHDQAIPHIEIGFDRNMAALRRKLRRELMEAGFSVQDSFLGYKPHSTLAYLDDNTEVYGGVVPTGSFQVEAIEVWGLPQMVPLRIHNSLVGSFGMKLTSHMIRSLSLRVAKTEWSEYFVRGSYLATFFDEKDIPERVFEVEDSQGVLHSIPNGVVVKAIASTRGSELRKIEDTIRKIDFHNGKVNHFLEHLAKGLAESYAGAFRFSSTHVAFNKYNPNELIGQAIKLFEEEQYGTGEEGGEMAEKLRNIARDAWNVWNHRER